MAQLIKVDLDKEKVLIVQACTRYLSPSEQAHLIAVATQAKSAVPRLPVPPPSGPSPSGNPLGDVPARSCQSLPNAYSRISENDFKRFTRVTLADALSVDRWRLLCGQVPTMVKLVPFRNNALMGSTHIYKAINHELRDSL